MKIENILRWPILSVCTVIDEEERRIMRKLYYVYGIMPTGRKETDKAKLRELELKEAEQASEIKTNFITVSTYEQEKIQKRKKEKRKENNPEKYPNTQKGAKLLGEQIFLAINMKQKSQKKLGKDF